MTVIEPLPAVARSVSVIASSSASTIDPPAFAVTASVRVRVLIDPPAVSLRFVASRRAWLAILPEAVRLIESPEAFTTAALVTAMSPAVAVTFRLPMPTVPAETLLPIVTELPVSVRSPFWVEIGRLMLSVLAASDRPPIVSKLELVITCRPGSLALSEIVALEAGRALIVRSPWVWSMLMAMSAAGPTFVPAKMLCWANPAVRTLIVPPSAAALLSVMLCEPLISPEAPVRMLWGLVELTWRLTKLVPAIWPSMRMSPPLAP